MRVLVNVFVLDVELVLVLARVTRLGLNEHLHKNEHTIEHQNEHEHEDTIQNEKEHEHQHGRTNGV